jgi:hypothetical protein
MPWPAPATLAQMGFTQVSYPASMILRVTAALADGLRQLRRHATGEVPMAPDATLADMRGVLDDALHVGDWRRIESNYAS